MAWARLDDAYYDNPKMLRVGLVGTGLHARAITYCARHETDGHLPLTWVEGQLLELKPAERKRVLADLEQAGAIVRQNGGFVVHDYLKFNPSREELAVKRESDRKRKGGNVNG